MSAREPAALSLVPASRSGADLPLGEIIPGSRYRILSLVGVGGMGVVYAAEHVDLQKRVAVKVLSAAAARVSEKAESFRREARTASRIGSPHICDVTDFGALPDGRLFLVMEYLDGVSLGRMLRAKGALQPAVVVPLLRQIAKALGATHDKGVIHLDVKPDNIMVIRRDRRDGFVKVVDFGIAALLEERRFGERVIAGTPEYVAPERILGRVYDHRADIYSLGVIAYELLTGVRPFSGRDYVATLTMHVKDQPLPMAVASPELKIQPPLERLVRRLLEKDPTSRPASMAETEALLCEAQIATGLRTPWDDLELPHIEEARRQSLAERMPSPGSTKRKAITGAAMAAALIGGAFSLYLAVFTKPSVIVKEVRLEITKTEEAPVVAAWLVRADQAMRRQWYVRPRGTSALDYIVSAEGEAARLTRTSPGAKLLRNAYGSALVALGDELLQAGLPELAVVKYRDALAFLPEDPALSEKVLQADLPTARTSLGVKKKELHEVIAAQGKARAPELSDQARELSAALFDAARSARTSEARRDVEELTRLDAEGRLRARLADGLRRFAKKAADAGRASEARAMFEIVAALDPSDRLSARLAEIDLPRKVGVGPASELSGGAVKGAGAEAGAEESPKQASASGASSHVGRGRRVVEAGQGASPESQRDEVAARAAVRDGRHAFAGARLAEAAEAFKRAVKADPMNAAAVAGLGHVAFERAQYAEALDYARRAAVLAPQMGSTHVLLGDAYFKLLRYKDALLAYGRARALHVPSSMIEPRVARASAKLQ